MSKKKFRDTKEAKKYTPEYLDHLDKIKKLENQFKLDPNSNTAKPLSEAKNNEFKNMEDIFIPEYLKKRHKRAKKKVKELDYNGYDLRVVYKGYEPRAIQVVADFDRSEISE